MLKCLCRALVSTLAGAAVVPFFIPTEVMAKYTGVVIRQNTPVCEQTGYLGQYDRTDNSITVCVDNYMEKGVARSSVIRHEIVHRIQCNIGVKEVIPEDVLTQVIRYTMSDEETLGVLLLYDHEDHQGEFEARVFQNLPGGIISGALFYTNIYRNIRKSL